MSDHKKDEELLDEVCRAQRNEAYAESAFDRIGAGRAGEELVQARAELLAHIGELRASLPAAEVQAWTSISDAPKDGTILLVNDTTGTTPWAAARWVEGDEWSGWIYDDDALQDNSPLGPQPTHFMNPGSPSTERNPS